MNSRIITIVSVIFVSSVDTTSGLIYPNFRQRYSTRYCTTGKQKNVANVSDQKKMRRLTLNSYPSLRREWDQSPFSKPTKQPSKFFSTESRRRYGDKRRRGDLPPLIRDALETTQIETEELILRELRNFDYHGLIQTLSFEGEPQQAEKVLELWLRAYNAPRPSSRLNMKRPNVSTFNVILTGYARSGLEIAGPTAQAILDRMEDQPTSWVEEPEVKNRFSRIANVPRPDTITYNAAINCWSKSKTPESLDIVSQLLHRMEYMYYEKNISRVRPDEITYGAVIDTFRSNATRAEGVLQHMKSLSIANPQTAARPTVRHFNGVLAALAKSSPLGAADAAIRAEQLIQQAEEEFDEGNVISNFLPDTMSYNIAINCWARSGHPLAAENAERILNRMERKYQSFKPIDETFSRVRPDAVSFNTVIAAWSRTAKSGSAQAAENLLLRMEHLYQIEGRSEMKPDSFSYSSVIHAYAKSGVVGSARRGHDILDRMIILHANGNEKLKPNAVVFNTVINGYVNSGEWSDGAAARVDQILEQMLLLYRSGNADVKPNQRTYTTVINALSKSGVPGAIEKIEKILDNMCASTDSNDWPTAHTFTSVVSACANSSDEDKAGKALRFLRRMQRMHSSGKYLNLKPNVYVYNSVLHACASSAGGKPETVESAFKVACGLFDELCKSNDDQPNDVTYSIFIRVCKQLMSEGALQRKMIEAVFRRCCRNGKVNLAVLRQVKEAASLELWIEIMKEKAGKSDLTIKDLPEEWTRNISKI